MSMWHHSILANKLQKSKLSNEKESKFLETKITEEGSQEIQDLEKIKLMIVESNMTQKSRIK